MWVAIFVICLAAVLLFLLWVPLEIVVHIEKQKQVRLSTRLVWFFGAVSKELAGAKPKPRKPRPESESTGRRAPDIRMLFAIVRTRGLLRQTLRLLRDIFRKFRFRDMEVNIRVGLDDPADTGFLFAFIGPIRPFLAPAWSERINIQPAFGDGAVCEGYLQGALRIQPIALVPPLGRFLFSPPALRLAGVAIKRKWKRRK